MYFIGITLGLCERTGILYSEQKLVFSASTVERICTGVCRVDAQFIIFRLIIFTLIVMCSIYLHPDPLN